MKTFTALLLTLLFLVPASAQHHLAGLWEGIITVGGIYTKKGYKMEMRLEVEGNKISGKTYIYLSEKQVVEMRIRGTLYSDRSIYLEEERINTKADTSFYPSFIRKYEMIYNRSIWESSLKGYWQEVRPDSFHEGRERGRIFLKTKGVKSVIYKN